MEFKSQVDLETKLVATIFALVYASGFLVVSVYQGTYGFALFEFFKPRVFSAGILFVVFLLVPAIAASRVFGIFGLRIRSKPGAGYVGNAWFGRISSACNWYVYAVALAFAAVPLFQSNLIFIPTSPRLFFSYVPLFLVLVVVGNIVPPLATTIICTIIFALSVTVVFFAMTRDFFWLTMWFYAVGIAFIIAYFKFTDTEQQRVVKWESRALVNVLLLVVIFATNFYGKIRVSFGGGAPVPATMTFSQALPISNSQTMALMILDETEHGYYVLRNGDKKAFFIPRGLVTSVGFGTEKAADTH